jgi:nitroreductase
MEFFDVIQKRKAIRKFKSNHGIADTDLTKLLETISLAPSARNLQGYKVFIATSKEKIEQIYNSCYNQRSDFINNAALILVFCTDPKKSIEMFGKRGENLYALQDATIAASYAQLTATALGYGSCWVGNFKEDEIKKIVQTDLTPISLIIIGIPDENPERNPRKSLDQISQIV